MRRPGGQAAAAMASAASPPNGVPAPRRRRAPLLPWRSTSGRFLLLHLVLSLACVVPILLYLYFQIDRVLLADFARPLEYRQSNLENHYKSGGIAELTTSVASRAERAHRDQTAILLVDAQGRKLAGNLSAWPGDLAAPQDWTPVTLQRDGTAHPDEFLVRTALFGPGYRLLLGGLLDNRADMRAALLLALLAAFALAIPIGLLGSLTIVHEMNRMVAAIASIGQHVGAGDLRRRAETDGSGDPVDRLKVSLNAMLDRIEALVEEHRVLTDALAHDLRSPLTRIHIQVTQGLAEAPGRDQQPRFEAIAQEVARVLHMLESALEISRAEAGIGRGTFERFDLGAMLRDLHEIYQPLAAASGVTITVSCPPDLDFYGNRALVARALANLIDNALKYGAQGGEIALEASATETQAHLCVADRAAGIPAERRTEAIRKFGRLDGARSTPGSGLGLTLVSAVASLHDGRFELEDNRPGLRARLVLSRQLTASSQAQGATP
ncbi:sensor histidine kinase [Novosphingobium album (ex Liu et al. 2023)]|uniref:histidine kinase n=1 Tax=Novosphingobium album (ex Liu et al. 2023) TaxID=3031130 RepID=A0ABT5WW07_9SPHN|nr:HAMP domain-containing sensor histidine kinase [Novosphingobium album (ex Liu et al. 2023)]MDE8654047.1 HAMP domain-containing sensor histidine kinase [Novosphingobium album (ex Liu et al. 2023)]